jgi:hypothetical protein
MAFKELLISYAPDADKTKHRSFIDTGKYQEFLYQEQMDRAILFH